MERICKHCQNSFNIENESKGFMANHSRWCNKNPKRKDYTETLNNSRKAAHSKEANAKRNASMSQNWKEGKYDHIDHGASTRGMKHTEQSRKNMSIGSAASNHRRLRKGTVMYKGILLDSSWELALAKRLDELKIKWIRPEPIPWIDSDNNPHKFFPDFYLPEHDLYLDPKNPHAYNVQRNKIDILNITYKNIRWITSIAECSSFNI
jgi:hypothetical protein